MAAPLDSDWAKTVLSDGNLNRTTYGQGTSFPSSWPLDRIFWRTDRNRLYKNIGTVSAPVWEGVENPVGAIAMYAGPGSDLPAGALICDGSQVSRATYPELFAKIGTEYGEGDGSTTFNLPDFQTDNRFPRAISDDDARGETGGEDSHTLTIDEMPAHNHPGSTTDAARLQSTTANTWSPTGNNRFEGASVNVASQGGGMPHENRPPYLGVHFIIYV